MNKIYIKSLSDLEGNLYDFKILFAYHSNKIENNDISFHDTRDIFEKGTVSGFSGSLRTLYEIENQLHCYNYIAPLIVEKKELSIDLIKKIHYKLTRGTYNEVRYNIKGERPGEFKKNDYVTGVNEVGSYPDEVVDDLTDLLEEINNYNGSNHFSVGVYLHAMFENIHPFADGNGRVGRTIMNYYFMINDIAPVVIYEEDRKNYYRALEQFDSEDSKLEPLINFIENQQNKTWNKTRKKKNVSIDKSIDDFDI